MVTSQKQWRQCLVLLLQKILKYIHDLDVAQCTYLLSNVLKNWPYYDYDYQKYEYHYQKYQNYTIISQPSVKDPWNAS